MEAIKRLINRLYPELMAGYHKPMLGRIELITKAPVNGGQCTLDEPLYAVDIQPLDENFKNRGKLLRDVVLGLSYAGQEKGFFAFPDEGCIVEFCFAYASPKLIFVRGVIPWGIKLPPVDIDTALWYKSRQTWQGYDKDGNWHKHTTAGIQESCDQIREHSAKAKQILKSPKNWMGSEAENLFQIVIDSLSEIETALNTLSSHTHNGGQVGAPDQSGGISGPASNLASIRSGRLEPITE